MIHLSFTYLPTYLPVCVLEVMTMCIAWPTYGDLKTICSDLFSLPNNVAFRDQTQAVNIGIKHL